MDRRVLLASILFATTCGAEEAQIAVAANFAAPAKQLAERFAQRSGHKLSLSTGSTGKFYAQIVNGAPFDVLLSADEETPRRLEREKLAVPGSGFTYAIGRLVLWSPRRGLVDANGEVLRRGTFRHLAIANPRLAPYGAAAPAGDGKARCVAGAARSLVQGENIAQTFQFVASGNAELGFVAWSQVDRRRRGRARLALAGAAGAVRADSPGRRAACRGPPATRPRASFSPSWASPRHAS